MASFDKTIFVFILSLITVLFFNSANKYEDHDEEIIRNNKFKDPIDEWHINGESVVTDGSGIAKLNNANSEADVYISQRIIGADKYSYLRLSCEAKTNGIIGGHKEWMNARVTLLSYDAQNNALYRIPHQLMNIRGNTRWEKYTAVFHKTALVNRLRLTIQIPYATGTMWVKNISIVPVYENTMYKLLKYILGSIWIFTLLLIIIRVIKQLSLSYNTLLVVFLIAIILTCSLLPGSIKDILLGEYMMSNNANLISRFSFTLYPPEFSLLKIGHFLLFFLLGSITTLSYYQRIQSMKLLCILLLFAFITEVLQLFIAGRHAETVDFLIDSSGIFAGYLIFAYYLSNTAKMHRPGK